MLNASVPLLDKSNCQQFGFTFIKEFFCPFATGTLFSVYRDEHHVAIQSEQTFSLRRTRAQLMLPLVAIPWIVDSIRNGFWKKPSDGGLPKNKHFVSDIFEEEELVVQRSMNAGAEGEMGFTFYNKSRQSYISPSSKQSDAYTDKLLEDDLLPVLEAL